MFGGSKPTASEITESRERLQAAWKQEEADVSQECPLQGSPDAPPHGGKCCKCSKDQSVSHTIPRSKEAIEEAERLKQFLDTNKDLGIEGTEISKLKEEAGSMFGVLVCIDKEGSKVVLKAFSGGFDDTFIKDVKGWSPPLGGKSETERHLQEQAWEEKVKRESKIDRMDQIKKQLQDGQRDADKAYKACEPELKRIGTMKLTGEEWNTLGYDKPPEDTKKGSEAYNKVAEQLYKPFAAKRESEWSKWQEKRKALELEQKELLADLQKRDAISGLTDYENALNEQRTFLAEQRKIENYQGEVASVMGACCPKDDVMATNGQMGSCAAPKLLAAAKAAGLVPVSLAEFWYGADTSERKHGQYYESCQFCRSILGFALCGLPEVQKQLDTALGQRV